MKDGHYIEEDQAATDGRDFGPAIGIDFGSKRIGIAVSDDSGLMAFAHETVPNSATDTIIREGALEHIVALVLYRKAQAIVFGDSRDFNMKENVVMDEARRFTTDLAHQLASAGSTAEIVFEPEFLSTHQAHMTHRGLGGTTNKASGALDASAAAVILQAYIDRKRSV